MSADQDSTVEEQSIKDAAIEAAMMDLLDVKLAGFMARSDLSESPPEDKVAIRAAFFLGVSAGISMVNTVKHSEEIKASSDSDTDET